VAEVAFAQEGGGHGFFDDVAWGEGAVALVLYQVSQAANGCKKR